MHTFSSEYGEQAYEKYFVLNHIVSDFEKLKNICYLLLKIAFNYNLYK